MGLVQRLLVCSMKLALVAHVFLVRWEELPAQPQPLGTSGGALRGADARLQR